jgi:hypothetical protein
VQACEPVYCGCGASASCGGFIGCIAGCAAGDTACTHACASANEGGIALAARLGDCSARSCQQSCPAATRLAPPSYLVLLRAAGEHVLPTRVRLLIDCASACAERRRRGCS